MLRALLLIALFSAVAIAQVQVAPLMPAQPVPIRPKLAAAKAAVPPDPAKDDAKALADQKLSADDAEALIGYFKTRTLSKEQIESIQAIIRRMGDESFEERMKASKEAEKIGIAAIYPLRMAATTDPDPEISFRSGETLRVVEKVPQAAVASAACRALAKLKPPEAVATLLGFLPFSDNVSVDDDLRVALKALAIKDGKLDSTLVKTLNDPMPQRRAASAVALIEASIEHKQHVAEVATLVKPLLKGEPDGDARFRVAFILATTGHNQDAILALVETLPTFTALRGRVWQIEDILLQVAGNKKPPYIKLGSDAAALEKGRDEWRTWLNANLKPEDYEKFTWKQRTTGELGMMLADNNWGSGRVVMMTPDMKTKWRINGIMSPADFYIKPDNTVEILEQNYSRMRTFDMKGNQKTTKQMVDGQPMNIQYFENGNFIIAYRNAVIEYDSNWKKLNTYARPNHDLLAAAKYGDGPVWVLVQQQQLIKLDEKFKEQPNPIKIQNPHYQAKLEMLPNDRALVTDQNQVTEYDLKNGKVVWTFQAQTPFCTHRMLNGNTLVCDTGKRKVVEVAPDGSIVWTYTPPDNMMPMRAYRQ